MAGSAGLHKSTEKERIVKFSLPKKDADKLGEYPHLVEQQISCRLIKVVLENGEIEILCSSLVNHIKYKREEFELLYHYRWNEEEAYKLLKSRIELEAFSGKMDKAVKQDFLAKVFLMTLTAAYAHPIEEKLRAEHQADKDRKHPQKINKTSAVAMVMDMAIPMFIKRKFKQALKAFDQLIYLTREVVRPDRNNPRKKRPKKQYHMNQ